jgi:hypothetical protein
MLSGRWTFRSYRNEPALVGDDGAAALGLILAEGVLDLEETGPASFRGGLGMADGRALSVTGTMIEPGGGEQAEYAITAIGIPGSATQGWRYDYRCRLAHRWPDAAGQVDALVGTVVRVNGHGDDAPAGGTASFVAVRQSETMPGRGRPRRRNALLAGI